ncbi:hypothetical protein C8R47DRAFT_1206598 [Mycena vitilis]|nr:hypothetical protein C8R47DRAFT_1206598 [Mycena vitilis]
MSPTNRGRGDTVLKYATVAASTLRDVADSSPIPFLRIIAAVSMSILTMVQSVRSNREECMRMISHIDELISVILRLCINEDDLSPATLHNIGRFAELVFPNSTLQKIHSYVTSQQNTSLLKRLFRQSENAALLEACNSGLRHALDVFGVESSLVTTSEMAYMRGQAEKRHKELVELFAGQSESEERDPAISLGTKQFFEFGNSTTSLVLLPATPKIFRGRGRELDEVVDLLLQSCSRVAILGPGGIGKTALATSALHHPAVSAKYLHRYFISCESATNYDDLVSIVASHLELSPSRNISKVIFRHFSGRPASILVLDNFETSWEPLGSRSQVEDFLSLLTDVPHLALLITMRGAERPGSVRWSRPFLPPLDPLSDAAARETFTDIADEKPHDADIRELLKLTNNLPLAVNLVANIAAFEGYDTVLSRWKDEKTTLLSEGPDKRSNLDLSIRLSLSSPRMLDSPGAHSLLSLLSLLPDGISDAELLQSDFAIPGMGRSKTTLMRTSLAYFDHDKRLRVLSPIREYILIHDNPTPSLCRPLRQHFHRLIMLWKDYQHLSTAGITQRIAANLGNFHAVLAHGLHWDEPDLTQTLFSIIAFDSFYRISGRRESGMLKLVTPYLERLKDPRLHSAYLGQFVQTWQYHPLPDPDVLEITAIRHFRAAGDISEEAHFICELGRYFRQHDNDLQKALRYYERGLSLAKEADNVKTQCLAMREAAECIWQLGHYREARVKTREMRRLAQIHGLFYAEAQAIRVDLLCRVSLGDLASCMKLSAEARSLLALCGFQGSSLDLTLLNSDAEVHLQKTEYAEARALYSRTSVEQAPLARAYDRLNLIWIDMEIGVDTSQVLRELDYFSRLILTFAMVVFRKQANRYDSHSL